MREIREEICVIVFPCLSSSSWELGSLILGDSRDDVVVVGVFVAAADDIELGCCWCFDRHEELVWRFDARLERQREWKS